MSKRDIVLTNVTVVQLLRPPCPGEGGGGATPGEASSLKLPQALPSHRSSSPSAHVPDPGAEGRRQAAAPHVSAPVTVGSRPRSKPAPHAIARSGRPDPKSRSREAGTAQAPAPARAPCWPPSGTAAELDDVSEPRHGLRLPEGRAGRGGGWWAPGPGSGARPPRQRGALRLARRPAS